MSNYFVYITTNPKKTTLYVGVTNGLYTRVKQHHENRENPKTFAGRYYCCKLIYSERFDNINMAIEREKDIQDLTRKKKEELISKLNPRWEFYDPYYLQ